MTLREVIPSLIRTYVPVTVGQVLAWLVVRGVIDTGTITDDQQATVSAVAGAVLTGVYYTVVRLAERRWPHVGVLLGSARQPVAYAPGEDVARGRVAASYVGRHRRSQADVDADIDTWRDQQG